MPEIPSRSKVKNVWGIRVQIGSSHIRPIFVHGKIPVGRFKVWVAFPWIEATYTSLMAPRLYGFGIWITKDWRDDG